MPRKKTGVVGVHEDECLRFINAVAKGEISPDADQIRCLMNGRVEEEVMDLVLASSETPTDAVAALSNLLRSAEEPARMEGKKGSTKENVKEWNTRERMTMQAMEAERVVSHVTPLPATPCPRRGGGCLENTELETVVTADTDSATDGHETVMDFVRNYAATVGAAEQNSRPEFEPPSNLPPGTTVPRDKRVHTAISLTAEKTIEVHGFESFLKVRSCYG
ncbi:unnamed protein product [Choristocarpus tenellus]